MVRWVSKMCIRDRRDAGNQAQRAPARGVWALHHTVRAGRHGAERSGQPLDLGGYTDEAHPAPVSYTHLAAMALNLKRMASAVFFYLHISYSAGTTAGFGSFLAFVNGSLSERKP